MENRLVLNAAFTIFEHKFFLLINEKKILKELNGMDVLNTIFLHDGDKNNLCYNLEFNNRNKLLEDYLSLGYTPQDIVNMNKDKLIDCFYQTFSPLHQIALNMGFENWKY